MKCCGKEMFDNINNFHCNICGKRIFKKKKRTICPKCKSGLYDNGNNVHCVKCGYREFIHGIY